MLKWSYEFIRKVSSKERTFVADELGKKSYDLSRELHNNGFEWVRITAKIYFAKSVSRQGFKFITTLIQKQFYFTSNLVTYTRKLSFPDGQLWAWL